MRCQSGLPNRHGFQDLLGAKPKWGAMVVSSGSRGVYFYRTAFALCDIQTKGISGSNSHSRLMVESLLGFSCRKHDRFAIFRQGNGLILGAVSLRLVCYFAGRMLTFHNSILESFPIVPKSMRLLKNLSLFTGQSGSFLLVRDSPMI